MTESAQRSYQMRLDEKSLQLYLRLQHGDVRKETEPTPMIVGEARLTMAALKSDGRIADFCLFEQELGEVWTKLHKRKVDLAEPIEFVIAGGFPRLNGVVLQIVGEGRSRKLFLTMTAPRYIARKWHPEWIYLYILSEMRRANLNDHVDRSQVYALWAQLAYNGMVIASAPLKYRREKKRYSDRKDVRVLSRPRRGYAEVEFLTPRAFDTIATEGEKWCLNARKRIRKLASDPGGSGYYLPLLDYLRATIARGAGNPQRLGLYLPEGVFTGITITDSLFPDDVLRGLPHGAGHVFATVFREMLRLNGASFEQDWFSQKLAMPLSADTIEAIMAVLRARGLVTEVNDDRDAMHYALNNEIRYVGFRTAGAKPSEFDFAAARLGALSLRQSNEMDGLPTAAATVFAASENELATLIALVRSYRKRLLALAREDETLDCVVQFNLHLMPMTSVSPDYRKLDMSDESVATPEENTCLQKILPEIRKIEAYRNDEKWLRARILLSLGKNVLTTKPHSVVASEQDRAFLEALVALGEDVLQGQPLNRRDMTSIILACARYRVPALLALVRELSAELRAAAQEMRGKDQVYVFSYQTCMHTR